MTLSERRSQNLYREICILPTPLCKGTCSFCFLNRDVVGDREWKKLFENVSKFMSTYPQSSKLEVRIFGGELFMDELLTEDYIENLYALFDLVMIYSLRNGWGIDVPVSPENIGEKGVELIKKLQDEFKFRLFVPFSLGRIDTPDREVGYWKNLDLLKGRIFNIGILPFGPDKEWFKYRTKLEQYAKIAYEEPVMLDGYHFSYKDYSIEPNFEYVRCVSNNIRFITSKGVFTCAGATKKPSWIDRAEWDKLCNDPEYLEEGYQQVIDWYGCDICEKQDTCPGMCWKTYYAQKTLYNNRKCLYKDKL